jgi:flagellar biosynthetic protein FliP
MIAARLAALALAFALGTPPAPAQTGSSTDRPDPPTNLGANVPVRAPAAPSPPPAAESTVLPIGSPKQLLSTAQTVALFALFSMIPAAVLMVSAFVRISIVLTLLRQALGSPQVPGNQVLMALSLLLTALVMWPVGERVHRRAIAPLVAGQIDVYAAWDAGTAPIKGFMRDQIDRAGHGDYVLTLHAHAFPDAPEPSTYEEVPLRVLAPAYLLSELTTALFIGFALYLPFLVIDLVVSAVLSAMGLFMLPPALVALPLKLILFVLADGWMLVADMLLRSFGSV